MEVFYGRDILLLAPLLLLCGMQLLWMLIPAGRIKVPNRALDLLVCGCITLAVGTLLRQYPWTTMPTQTDSSVFLYIGKQMHLGKTPYIDLFDHKGPALYFIQYLGYASWPGSIAGGVWILEMISFFLLTLMMLKIAGFATEDRRNAYLASILVLLVCAFKLYQGGNYTEEHALLWITLSAYIFFSFFRTGNYTKGQLFLLGFSCMAVLLQQANLVTVWVAFVPLVMIRLIREKRYREIWTCMLLFLLGMMAALLPVLIWAAWKGCLKEMWHYYIVFNLTYSENMAPGPAGYLQLTRNNLMRIWPGILAMAVSLVYERKNRLQWLNLWFFVVSLVLMQLSGRDSLYYLLILLPALILPAAGLFDALQCLLYRRVNREKNTAVIVLCCLLLATAAVAHRAVSNLRPRYNDGVVAYLTEQTEEQDDVLIIGNYAWPYLAADRATQNRFFFQWPPIQVSDELYQEFLAELNQHPSDYIILAEHENAELKIPGEGKIDNMLEMLTAEGYRKEQHEGFSAYIAPWKQQ